MADPLSSIWVDIALWLADKTEVSQIPDRSPTVAAALTTDNTVLAVSSAAPLCGPLATSACGVSAKARKSAVRL